MENVRNKAIEAFRGDLQARNELMQYFTRLEYKSSAKGTRDTTVSYLSSVNSSGR